MILNLLRVEALRVEEMIKRSFSENASQRLLPDQQKKVAEASCHLTGIFDEKLTPASLEREAALDTAKARVRHLPARHREAI